ncbi:apoptosis facilitator Bcl-2-like protein 14 [Conger conger]|uniref:apoptosis facilitator Bcl-2-like protein 14 n=1 Tax=Conger conger TaxID=82655 RepID=UPI002A5A90DA|nr:apoptosis facilitator Bcl-2-like protein 14 [Conger conger]
MSARPASPAPSISLLEIRSETRLVLGAFLRRSAAVPPGQRPGRVGGTYWDHNKFRASSKDGHCITEGDQNGRRRAEADQNGLCRAEGDKDGRRRAEGDKDGRRRAGGDKDGRRRAEGDKDGLHGAEGDKDGRRRAEGDRDSLDLQSSSEEEKKYSLKDLIKKHKKSRSFKSRLRRDQERMVGSPQEEVVSPSSSSSEDMSDSEEENKKKKKKKKKFKSSFASLLRKMKLSKKDPSNPKRPTSLVIQTDPVESLMSPGHTPEFFEEVADKVDKFAQSLKRKDHRPASSAPDKESIVQQLVQALQMQGDAINVKIQANPVLRSSLANMSYPSFANLVDTFDRQTCLLDPAPASPTLSRLVMTMEVSRHVITATGTQRIQGYAEHYIEKFNPWLKSHGGWDNILKLEDVSEYD